MLYIDEVYGEFEIGGVLVDLVESEKESELIEDNRKESDRIL